MEDRRTLFDHPEAISLRYATCVHESQKGEPLQDVRLRFSTDTRLSPGTFLDITITVAGDYHPFCTQVLSCEESGGQFETQVVFLTKHDTYRVRMVEQLCQIQSYRFRLEKEHGESLPFERAAEEWIARFGADFPSVPM